MKIILTYYGHSCFIIDIDGYKLAFDPYADYVPGYKSLSITANEALCSHGHDDHCYLDAVNFEQPEMNRPFTVTEIKSFHDPEEGKLRGENIIRIIDAGGCRIAHFGDIGCHPNADQMKLLENLDVALVPVGGTYTFDASETKALMDELKPRVIVPMHYRLGKYGFNVLSELNEFTKLYDQVNYVNKQSMALDKSMQGVYVLDFESAE